MTQTHPKRRPFSGQKHAMVGVLAVSIFGCSVSFQNEIVPTAGNSNVPHPPQPPAAPAARSPNIHWAHLDGPVLVAANGNAPQRSAMPTPYHAEAASQRVRLGQAIKRTADELGIDPEYLAGAISYETAGTFDPWKRGPSTRWGQHRGLIQWGQPQRFKYGVTEKSTIEEQMAAVTRYMRDAGVRPGDSLRDIYSAINAGRVGRYHARDASQGGAPGTVADKVARMGPHLANGRKLLARAGVQSSRSSR